jgi:hypothetical protein
MYMQLSFDCECRLFYGSGFIQVNIDKTPFQVDSVRKIIDKAVFWELRDYLFIDLLLLQK